MMKMKEFFNVVRNPTRAFDAIITGKKKEQIKNNCRLVVQIIETIILCDRNLLPLRGDCNDGPLDLTTPYTAGECMF